ncbi:MAG: hypothetical protein RR228_01485 [Bacilli bacterium]
MKDKLLMKKGFIILYLILIVLCICLGEEIEKINRVSKKSEIIIEKRIYLQDLYDCKFTF